MSERSTARFWIGPAGWSYEDWYGPVYPQPRPRGFRPLAFLSRYFDTIEVNSSFYRIPAAQMTARWPEQVPQEFRFAFKLTRTFTHDPPRAATGQDVRAFKEGVAPIREAGLLGPILVQFPWSFRFAPQSLERLRRIADWFGEYERAIEVRHASWAQPEALEQLPAFGGLCAIDQPQLRDCLGPITRVLGPRAYVRLHGRNAAKWFADNIQTFERYDYLYDKKEIDEWIARLREIADQTRDVYVVANNHYRGQGVVNALEIKALLTGERLDVPDALLAHYPRLKRFAKPPKQPGLFS
jgi:uncharacterized protein YecE (DUF72 family)